MNCIALLIRGVRNLGPSGVTVPFFCQRPTLLLNASQCMLKPSFQIPGLAQPSRNYKVRAVLKKRCAGCYFERRFGRLYVECTLKPRHKQMQQVFGRAYYRDDYSTKNWKKSVHWGFDTNVRFYKLGDNKFARYNWLDGRLGKDL